MTDAVNALTAAQLDEIERVTLKPCPFCGGKADIVDVKRGRHAGGSYIECTRCRASGYIEFGEKATFVENWNRRTIDDAAFETLEQKREAADNLRLIDYISDRLGIPNNEELTRESFDAALARLGDHP